MLFNKTESKAENSKERSKEELEFVKDFIEEGLKITAVEIESTARIGRFDPNKQRPIRVKFTNRADQQKVLHNLGNLKVAEAKFKGIFVTIDRNQNQREEMKIMLLDAKVKSDASEDKFYLVRGSPFKPQIVEVPKKKWLPTIDKGNKRVGKYDILYCNIDVLTKTKLNLLDVCISTNSPDIICITEVLPKNSLVEATAETYQIWGYNLVAYLYLF